MRQGRISLTAKTFRCKTYDAHYVALVDVDGWWEIDTPPPNWEERPQEGPWRLFRVIQGEREWFISAYRKRLDFSLCVSGARTDSDSVNREVVTTLAWEADRLVRELRTFLNEPKIHSITYFPIAHVRDYYVHPTRLQRLGASIRRAGTDLWKRVRGQRIGPPAPALAFLSDRVTTFSFRMFDPGEPHKPVFVEISRHVITCYGVSDPVLQDVFNLVHEHFLYELAAQMRKAPWRPATEYSLMLTPERVFGFTDGLAKTTVATELNLLLYETAARVGVFGIAAASSLILLLEVSQHLPWRESVQVPIAVGAWIVSLSFLWLISTQLTGRWRIYRHE